ncbi:MAG: PAS domain S-box protein, partial [Burkholderiaceae bacterium]
MTTACDEAARLEALHQYRILDTDPDERFDAITRLAASICDTPMALVTLVDAQRQWFKSSVGVDIAETTRDVSFCAHAISRSEVFIVADAQADERFAANPLVTGAPNIRFYAGAPLINADGHALGTLCVLDRRPRQLTSEQLATICILSDVVVSQLELRRNNVALEEARDRLKLILDATAEGICGVDTQGRTSFVNQAAARMLGWTPDELMGRTMHHLVHHSYADGSAYSMDQCPVHAACREGIAHEVHGEVFWRRDGSHFPVEYSSTPLYRDGSIEGAVVVFEDIAERVRSEDALRTHEARTGAMLATALDCVVGMDHRGRIIEFNPAAEATFGYTRASV